MPSNFTPNYQLNQWEASDRVLRTDFNADNAKIDAAIAAEEEARTAADAAQQAVLEDHTALLAKRGNCRIVWGSYQGSGLAGPGNPTSLTFDGRPLAVFIMSDFDGSNTYTPLMGLIRDVPWGKAAVQGHCSVTWTENGVSWYNNANNVGSPQYQMSSGSYHYFALLAADE